MSNFWSPPTRNKRQRETAFANTVYYAHEGFCGCGDFAFHLLSIVYSFARGDTERLLRQVLASSNPPLCLTSGEDHTPLISADAGEENLGIDGLEDGELDRLFTEEEEPTEENPVRELAG